MRLLAAAVMDVSIVLLVALAAAAALRRHSAALRHWILTVAIACALAAPLLELGLPAWRLPAGTSRWATTIVSPGTLAVFESIVADGTAATPAATPTSGWTPDVATLQVVLLAAWGIGAAAALLLLLTRLVHLKRLSRRVEPVDDPRWQGLLQAMARAHGVSRRVDLVRSPNPAMVVTWGLFRPRIVVPTCAWSDARIRVVLSHELAHVRRNDWGVQLAASVLQSLYWFHPLVWMAARTLRREAERACDDLVLKAGVAGPEYAGHLLAVARAASSLRAESAAAAIARPSTLEERIRAMLNVRLNRDPLTRRSRIAAVLIVALVALAAATSSIGAAAVGRRLDFRCHLRPGRRSRARRGAEGRAGGRRPRLYGDNRSRRLLHTPRSPRWRVRAHDESRRASPSSRQRSTSGPVIGSSAMSCCRSVRSRKR